MYISGVEREFAGFTLDTSAIELHSTNKRNILLPYLGELPGAVRVNDGAYISVNITLQLNVNILLTVRLGRKERKYLVEATADEKDDLLFRFFFVKRSETGYHTRWDAGLTHYWLGHYQCSYGIWRRFVYEGRDICNVLDQLTPYALARVARHIGG